MQIWLLKVLDLKQDLNDTTDFRRILQNEILWKFIQWLSSLLHEGSPKN
jgi:hypothetical protein